MSEIPSGLVGDVGAYGQPAKASIGSFKGVMLCNRPNEFGLQRRPEPTGPIPFNSRVDPKMQNPIGWNPCAKVYPRSQKKKSVFAGVLGRHKNFIKNLEMQKKLEKEEMNMFQELQDQKVDKFKQQADKQRQKIKQLKETNDDLNDDAGDDNEQQMQYKAELEQQMDHSSQKSQKSKLRAKKGSKPAWATTPAQQEEDKEREIDDLLEFAYELDYDKYMDDFEVKQAFEIIKERIGEIKKDDDWKQQIAAEWNQATDEAPQAQEQRSEAASVYSYRSSKSKASMQSRIRAEKKKQNQENAEWDRSTVASQQEKTVEDRIASKIANDLLNDNQKLRGMHSKQSLKKVLEREAKRQLLLETGGTYQSPIIATTDLKGRVDRSDPSNLPYLHKCPAV